MNTYTGLVVGAASATSMATAVYLGKLGDRVGHLPILMAGGLTAGLLFLLQSAARDAWQLLILQALTGAAIGGIIPAVSALLAHYTQLGQEGSVYGLDNSIVAGARAIAPMVGGGIAFWLGFRSTFILSGLIFLLICLTAGLKLRK